MPRPSFSLLDRPYKRVLFVLAAGLLAGALGYLIHLLPASSPGPVGSWMQLPPPPAHLTRFVSDTSHPPTDGALVAATAGGSLYALDCSGAACVWAARDAPPVPDEPLTLWCGPVPSTEPGSGGMPAAPGPVVATYAYRYCGADYMIDSHYILLEDGSVWEWESHYYARGQMYASFFRTAAAVVCTGCGAIGGIIAGLVVVIAASRRAARLQQQAGEE